jgi:UDP-glucuronate decarboxylase
MIILVTGGCGFIGSHLCRFLINSGNKVICLDNNMSGSLDNVKDLIDSDNFTFIEHDIVEPMYFNNYKIDQIYHLACPAAPKIYQSDPIKTIKTNVFGTLNALGIAKLHGARILLTSTSEIYGDPEVSPQSEIYRGNVNPNGIRACYDEGKRIAETLMFDYHRKHNVAICVARIFNTYGPCMSKNDGRASINFVLQMLKNEDITIYGEGKQTRSFCYIDDTVNGLVKLMNSPNEITGPINIGNTSEITINELVEELKKIIKESTSKIIYLDMPEDDPKQRKPDIKKAKEQLRWEPNVGLNEGLTKMVDFYKKEMYFKTT